MVSDNKTTVDRCPHCGARKPKIGACLSSAKHDWRTPEWLVKKVSAFFGGTIDLDPCAPMRSEDWFASTNFNGQIGDGLSEGWTRSEVVTARNAYVNPPYGRSLSKWSKKIVDESKSDLEIIALTPSRTDTKWFRLMAEHCACVCLVASRIVFLGAAHGAPFPSAIWYFGSRHEEFRREFSDIGLVVFEIG